MNRQFFLGVLFGLVCMAVGIWTTYTALGDDEEAAPEVVAEESAGSVAEEVVMPTATLTLTPSPTLPPPTDIPLPTLPPPTDVPPPTIEPSIEQVIEPVSEEPPPVDDEPPLIEETPLSVMADDPTPETLAEPEITEEAALVEQPDEVDQPLPAPPQVFAQPPGDNRPPPEMPAPPQTEAQPPADDSQPEPPVVAPPAAETPAEPPAPVEPLPESAPEAEITEPEALPEIIEEAPVEPTPQATGEAETPVIEGEITEAPVTEALAGISGVIDRQQTPGQPEVQVIMLLPDGNRLDIPTDENGLFVVDNLAAGQYVLEAQAEGFLPRQATVTLDEGEYHQLPPVVLAVGDINGDGVIDILDVMLIAANFNTPADVAAADLNGDGWIDVRDLALAGAQFGLAGPLDWE